MIGARAWAGRMLAAAALSTCAACAEMSGVETRARLLAEPPCTDVFFPIYFAGAADQPPPAALALIRTAGSQARGCGPVKVEVLGLAPPDAPRDAALALSQERARRLAAALEGAGLPRPTFQLSPLGADAPARAADARRRRADVFIRFRR